MFAEMAILKGWVFVGVTSVALFLVVRGVEGSMRRAEEALRKSEEKYRSIFNAANDAMFIAGLDGVIMEVNGKAEELAGRPAGELVGRPYTALYPPGEGERYRRILNTAFEGGRPVSGSIHVERGDGSRVPVEMSASLAEFGGGKAMIGVLRDISHRQAAEARMRGQLDMLSALYSIDTAITQSLDLRVIFDVLLDRVISQLKVDAADILLMDPNTMIFSCSAGRGFRTGTATDTAQRLGEGFAGRSALQRRIVSVENIAGTKDDRAEAFVREGFVSYFAAPLVTKGQILGVLELFCRTRLSTDREWMDFLGMMASQAAIAIENAGLFDNLQRTNTELALAYDTTLEGWSRALDLRDRETVGHTTRVTGLTLKLARAMGMSEASLVHVRRGALLHDIGKMGIPDNILLKPGPLTGAEMEVMRRHPAYALDLLQPIAYLRPALPIPYLHHERWDGSGYPRGLAGEQIPLAARLFAVADVWDALSSERPYRPPWPRRRVVEHLQSRAGTHFDPNIVEKFIEVVGSGADPEPISN